MSDSRPVTGPRADGHPVEVPTELSSNAAFPPGFFEGIVEGSPDPFVIIDSAGNITWAGHSAARLVGRDGDEYVGHHISEFVTPAALPTAIEAFEEYTSPSAGYTGWVGPPVLLELLHADGTAVPVSIRQVPTVEPFDGLVLQLSADTSVQALYTTIELIVAGRPLDEILESILELIMIESPFSVPVIGRGWDGERFENVSAASGAPRLDGQALPAIPDGRSPWQAHFSTGGGGTDLSLETIDQRLRAAASDVGVVACWVVPVEGDPALDGVDPPAPDVRSDASTVLVLWRRAIGPPRLNVLRRIERIVGLIGVALRADASRRQLHQAARTDSVTGLPNRRALAEHFDDLARQPAGGGTLGVLFCDLDHFKEVNDEHGHSTGDRVLSITADRLRSRLRSGDVLARVGGDEFVVVTRAPDRTSVQSLADRILTALDEPITLGDVTVQLGISIGVATAHGLAAGPDAATTELIERADEALLRAKDLGRHRVVWAD